MIEKKRLLLFDVAKGFTILLVICGHNTFVLNGGRIFNRVISMSAHTRTHHYPMA